TDHAGYAEATFHDGALALRERRLSAIGPGEDLGAVVGGKDHDGVVIDAHLLELVHHDADVVVELRHAGFLYRPAVLGVSQGLVFGREVGDDVHPGWIEPQEERLVVGLVLVDELQGKVANFVIYGFHPLGIKRSSILDPLFADLAPARIHGGIIHVGRPRVDHVARTDDAQQLLRVTGVRGIFHRIEVIEVAEELVEAVHRRKEFILVAKVILAKLTGGVTHSFQRGGDRHRLRGYAYGSAGLADRGHAGAYWQLTGDEVRPACRAARLGVVVGKQHAFCGELVEVRRPPRHQAAVVGADIPHADVVTHDDDDVRPLAGHCGRWSRLLRLCRGCQPDGRECRSGDKRTAAQQEIAAFHSAARLRNSVVRISGRKLVTHDALLSVVIHTGSVRLMHRKPTSRVEMT